MKSTPFQLDKRCPSGSDPFIKIFLLNSCCHRYYSKGYQVGVCQEGVNNSVYASAFSLAMYAALRFAIFVLRCSKVNFFSDHLFFVIFLAAGFLWPGSDRMEECAFL